MVEAAPSPTVPKSYGSPHHANGVGRRGSFQDTASASENLSMLTIVECFWWIWILMDIVECFCWKAGIHENIEPSSRHLRSQLFQSWRLDVFIEQRLKYIVFTLHSPHRRKTIKIQFGFELRLPHSIVLFKVTFWGVHDCEPAWLCQSPLWALSVRSWGILRDPHRRPHGSTWKRW